MEFMTNPQQKALNKLPGLKANETSKKKGFFPKRRFKAADILKMIKNKDKVSHTMLSLIKSAKVIKEHDTKKEYKKIISKEEFLKLDEYIKNTLLMDSWGVATFEEKEIFKGDSIPYKNVIVLSKHMASKEFIKENLPNMDCMLEVMKVYGDTGVACLKATKFLRKMDFGAVPNHSLGGNIDYAKAGLKGNLGYIGKHGMLITPHSGPCNRLSIIYTSIENLGDFLNNKEDFSPGEAFCENCKKCIKACPYDAIYEKPKVCENGHIECISNERCNSGFAHYGCGICIAVCPFTTNDYKKILKK